LAGPELYDSYGRQLVLNEGIFLHDCFNLLARIADRENNSTGARLLPAGDQKITGRVILPQEGDVGRHMSVNRGERGLVGELDDEHRESNVTAGYWPPLVALLLLLLPVFSACQRQVDVSGTYLGFDSGGALVPCNQPRAIWRLADSTLAARYRAQRTSQGLFVRLIGVLRDSGSVYGAAHQSRAHYFDVQQIIEARPRHANECPIASDTLPAMLR
jgi:hypothetical protein